jgi:hypothetical protein
MLLNTPHPPEDMAFKQWRHSPKVFDSSQSSQESFNSPETGPQREEMENKPSTSRADEIYEATAGDTTKPQRTTPESHNDESSGTSSTESDDEPQDAQKQKPTSATAHAKQAKAKGQKFLSKQYKKFDLISMGKSKKSKTPENEQEVTTKSGRISKRPDKWKYV